MEQSYFVTCPKGLESLLQLEIENLGGQSVKQTVAGVNFAGSLETAYRICFWSRLANRLLLPLTRVELVKAEDLYEAAGSVDWSQWFSADKTLLVDFQGTSDLIRHTRFGAQRIKDAVVDHFVNQSGKRPSVEFNEPDVRINAYLAGNKLTVSLDLSGDSLHMRGYRQEGVAAPLKENLAAALLLRAGWNNNDEYQYLIDPMCGSGTLVIEAALMKADIAPGLFRDKFGFEAFNFHQNDLWQSLKAEAISRRQHGLEKPLPRMIGFDQSFKAIDIARANAAKVGLSDYVSFRQQALNQLTAINDSLTKGLVITNPPYGKRLQDKSELPDLFKTFGKRLGNYYNHSDVAIIIDDPELGFHLGYRLSHQYRFYNGSIPCRLLIFNIDDNNKIKNPGKVKPPKLADEVQPFVNRLLKNKKSLSGWLKQQNIHCYRLYDADIPEFSAAIDIYEDCAHIQEYAAPASVKPALARQRIDWMVQAVGQTLAIDTNKIFLKRRERQRGKEQYQALDSNTPDIVVSEGAARFYVNLGAYLDTGLFLDHRPLRQYFYKNLAQKRFLNLFCYTASASVQAALGGARTTNIDLSSNYIAWAKRNFELNSIALENHDFYSLDILEFLSSETLKNKKTQYDIIFLDPPTFSNSKKMKSAFDLQRDHIELIQRCMDLLAADGELYFSNNFRKFKLDNSIIEKYDVKDLTQWSIPRDFSRKKMHHCWRVARRAN